MCAIAREHSDEPWLCWGRFLEPSEHSLLELQSRLTRYQTQPIPLVFKRQFRFSRCPTIVRRACWWLLLNTSGRLRERKLGTFSLSTLAGQGVINRDHPSILTTSISYGPVDAAGNCVVTLIYDHRVFDGLRAACSLRKLESTLREDIAAELGRLAATRMVA
jgi:hypothetical protein